jgi:transposase
VKAAPDVLAAAPGRLKRLIADRGYDANHLRRELKAGGTTPVIPSTRSRKRPIPHDKQRYLDRWRIEAAFCRLKDFRRVATRYDKLASNFASAVALAAVIAFWC